jgi:6-phosphogluconolactonase
MARFAFDAATGLLDADPLPPVLVRPGAGPRHFVFHPNNRFMYLLNEYDGSLCPFGYDAHNGSLSEIQSPVPCRRTSKRTCRTCGRPCTSRPMASGSMLPARRTVAGGIQSRRRDGPCDAGRSFRDGGRNRGDFNIDPFGRYLLAAGLLTNMLVAFRINPANRRAYEACRISDG